MSVYMNMVSLCQVKHTIHTHFPDLTGTVTVKPVDTQFYTELQPYVVP